MRKRINISQIPTWVLILLSTWLTIACSPQLLNNQSGKSDDTDDDDEFETGKESAQVTGASLLSYDNANIECSLTLSASRCRAMAGNVVATGTVEGVSIEWKTPEKADGSSIPGISCEVGDDENPLTQDCSFTQLTAFTSLRFFLKVREDKKSKTIENTDTVSGGTYLLGRLTNRQNFGCYILDDGGLKCWGRNNRGMLGQGHTNDYGDDIGETLDNLSAIPLGTGRTVKQVHTSENDVCALLDNNTVKCWGYNVWYNAGQLHGNEIGNQPNELGDTLPPIDLGTGRTAKQIASGDVSNCAILDNDETVCWGSGAFGATGQGDENITGDAGGELGDSLVPLDFGTAGNATAIAAGYDHYCAILQNGLLKCWGNNDHGQLGLGSVDHKGDDPGEMGDNLIAVNLGAGRRAKAIAAAEFTTCAILDNDTLKCWGENSRGNLGQGHTNDIGDGPGEMGDNLPPIDVGTGRKVLQVSMSRYVTCAVLDDHTVKCWGGNHEGQLGQGDITQRGDQAGELGDNLLAIDVGTGRTVEEVSVGVDSVCVRLDFDAVKCWGSGVYGQLGLGDTLSHGKVSGEMGDNLPFLEL